VPRKPGNRRFSLERFGQGNGFPPVDAEPCAPAERCRLPGSDGPPCLPFLLPNCFKKRRRSLPCSRTAAASGAKHLGWCFGTWVGLLGVRTGKAPGALMTKDVFYISAESLLLLHLSAEGGCEKQRTGAGSRA